MYLNITKSNCRIFYSSVLKELLEIKSWDNPLYYSAARDVNNTEN